MNYYIVLFFLFLNITSYTLLAQKQVISLSNASFEDEPRYAKSPKGWYNCGDPAESPPDVHPIPDSDFQVTHRAIDGRTYVGLVVRDNETTESVGQRLSQALKTGQCYDFNLMLCRSKTYESESRTTGEAVNYNMPAKINIWGGRDYCDKKELLSTSSPVQNTRWKKYTFRLEPTAAHTYILIEATYATSNVDFYNGNILVDNASDIAQIPCVETPSVAAHSTPPVVEKPPASIAASRISTAVQASPSEPRKRTTRQPYRPAKVVYFKNRALKVGQTHPLRYVAFEADKAAATEGSYTMLDELYDFLIENENVVIEVGGHTNNTPPDAYCDKLSKERAGFVTEYLKRKGIAASRLSHKGYGKRKPLTSNRTAHGRKRNQRVEIKVLKIN